MGDDPLGNVVLSRPFQFALVPSARSDVAGGQVIWTPVLPKKLEPIKTRWIYAFELGAHDGDQKPILAAEYLADKNGKLGMVPGAKRRLVEAKIAPKPVSVDAAALPLVRQGQRLRYAFVVIRGDAKVGRLGKRAIWDIENWLHPFYERKDLADDFYFRHAPDAPTGPFFVTVIDILTIGEALSQSYQAALNEALNYSTVHKHNPDNAAVEIRSRKYQLAKMIKDSLLAPEGQPGDPLGLRDQLAGRGQVMLNFIDEHESKMRKLEWERRNTARELVRLFNSPLWIDAYRWYLGTPQDANRIGHFWLDATFRSLDRLGETPEGKALQRQLVKDAEHGLLSYLFEPDEEGEAHELYLQRFAIMRKAATAAIVGIGEMAPALLVYGKVRAAARKKVIKSIKAFFTETEITILMRGPRGAVCRALRITTKSVHIEIKYAQAQANLEKWVEEGKPHWPEGTKPAKVSDILGRLLIAIEVINLFNEAEEYRRGTGSAEKVFGASIDLVVAAEGPVSSFFTHAAPGAEAHEAGMAAGEAGAAAEEEAAGLLRRLPAAAVFKLLGAVSAAIDLHVNIGEGKEASEHGDRGVAAGKYVTAAGSGVLVASSVLNAAGYMAEAAVLTAASATLLVVGVVVVAAGAVLIAYFSRSSWQKMAAHSVFGITPAAEGHEKWSGGKFSEWTETPEGLDKQIMVLTAMLCSFKFKGVGFGDYSMIVTFGSLPPHARLEARFLVEYDNGQSIKPTYLIDLEKMAPASGDAPDELIPLRSEGRGLQITAVRPAWASTTRIKTAECELRIKYAHGDSDSAVATGTIPVGKPSRYTIRDSSWGMGNLQEGSSLEGGDD